MAVGVLWKPRDARERAIVDTAFPDVRWLADGDSAKDVRVALTFFPSRELRDLKIGWADMPKLQLIQACTSGLNHMGWSDLPNVSVCATPGATAPFVAEHVLAVTLAWARGLFRHTKEIRNGVLDVGAPVRSVSELRVGIVGYGGIGQATAQLLRSLGARVEAVNRTPTEGAAGMAQLGPMMARSDVVVLCLPLTKETEGLIGIDLLSGMMGRPALLVNVARGAIVQEDALFAWLDSSQTKHWAALDVWWQYPRQGRPFTEAFETLPNVIMTPHNSPNVSGFRHAMIAQAVNQVSHYRKTGEAMHEHHAADYETAVPGDDR